MKSKLLILALFAQLFTISTLAYDAYIGGIYYNLDINNRTAEVTCKHGLDEYDVNTDWDSNYNYYRTRYNTFYSGSITIPEKVVYSGVTYKVTSIGSGAFICCEKLTSVTIPSSVTRIGSSAFWGCDELTSLTIPPSVVFIGISAFTSCPWYNSFLSRQDGLVYINNVLYKYKGAMEENAEIVLKEGTTCICGYAFDGCSNMASIVIPETVAYIGSFAFQDCSSLKSITLPKKLLLLSACGTFLGCNSLESIVIPAFDDYRGNLIGAGMFASCISLKRATFAEGVTIVPYSTFSGCSNLSYVSLPSTITEIASSAFEDCDNLTTVKVAMKQPVSIYESTFPNRANATLYVPKGCKAAYAEASFWRGFKEIIEVDDDTDVSQLDNVVYLEKTEGNAGSTATLSFKMKNSVAIRGFQFDLYLPEGVTVVKNARGRIQGSLSSGRLPEDDEHTLTITEQADGAIRFLCGSQYDETFTGNDGEIATLQVSIAGDMEDGDYPIEMKKICLSETDITKYYDVERVKSTLTIWSYTKGDIDGDGAVNVSDYIGIANHILGIPQAVFIETAGDVDGDNNINVTDYIGVANIIMTGSPFGNSSNVKPMKAKSSDLSTKDNVIYVEPLTTEAGTQATLSFKMKNSAAIRGFQFDLYLPEGVTAVKNNKGRIKGLLSDGRLPEDDEHTLIMQEQDNGVIRFLCGSQYDETFTGNEGEIATLQVNIAEGIASGDYPVVLRNMRLTETNISRFYDSDEVESTITIDDADGMAEYLEDSSIPDVIYNLAGQRLSKPQRGINIIGGKKMFVK